MNLPTKDRPEVFCHECGALVGPDGTNIVTTLQVDGGVAIVGLGLCAEHKDDELARSKCMWAIERETGK